MGTNSLIETRMKASDEVKDRGWRDSTKKEKGLRGMDNSVVIVGGKGGIRGLNGNGKKYN